jgi:hypothetical protein
MRIPGDRERPFQRKVSTDSGIVSTDSGIVSRDSRDREQGFQGS